MKSIITLVILTFSVFLQTNISGKVVDKKKLAISVDVMLHSVEESLAWFSTNKHLDLIF